MDLTLVSVIVSVSAAILSAVGFVGWLTWKLNDQFKNLSVQITALSGQISALTVRVDGMEKHFDARLGNLERDVHSINEHLRRRPE